MPSTQCSAQSGTPRNRTRAPRGLVNSIDAGSSVDRKVQRERTLIGHAVLLRAHGEADLGFDTLRARLRRRERNIEARELFAEARRIGALQLGLRQLHALAAM